MTHQVACLDVWAPAVREVVRQAAPPELVLHFADSYDAPEQLALSAQADILLPGFAAVTADMLARSPRVRMIHKWGIGIDAIDLDAVRRHGVALAITTGANAGPVAELAIALMLAVYRRIPYVNRAMREGRWPTPEMRETCYQITGKTVGLMGFGHIGRMLARRLRGFDAQVIYFDTRPADAGTEQELQARYVPMDELLARSDILSLHAPLVPQTAHLINARTIAAMKDGAVLINTARGALIDEAALIEALRTGVIAGAGLDVQEVEPLDDSSPLFTMDNVIITPHMGWRGLETRRRLVAMVGDNFRAFSEGHPINQVA